MFDMFGMIGSFFHNLCDSLKSKYQFAWPVNRDKWMAENNIAIEVARLLESEKYGCYAFAGCPISGEHRDLVIVDKKKTWACQVEFKHLYYNNLDKVENDINRVYRQDIFKKYLKEVLSLNSIDDKNIYGLFLAGGMSDMYYWWLSFDEKGNRTPNYERAQQFFDSGSMSPEQKVDHFNFIRNCYNWEEPSKLDCRKDSIQFDGEEISYWHVFYLTQCGMKLN